MTPSCKLCCCLLLLALANTVYCDDSAAGGTTTSTVGEDVVIDTAPTQGTDLPVYLQPLGRRAGPQQGQDQQLQQRQATTPQVGINDPSLLPDCRPGNGVICSDRDYTKLLQVQPANFDLTDNYVFAGFNPRVEDSAGLDTKVELGSRSFSTAAKALANGEIKSNIGNEVLNTATETTNTVAGAALKNNRYELAVPEKLTFTVGKTDSANSNERRTNRPNFYYVLGQNFGLPVGLSLAKDGVTGKR